MSMYKDYNRRDKSLKAKVSLVTVLFLIGFLYLSLIMITISLFVVGFELFFIYQVPHLGLLYLLIASIIIRGFFVWQEPKSGMLVTSEEQPELIKLVKEVANRVGTEMVDEIRIFSNSSIGVYESTDLLRLFFKGKRVLLLGIASLHVLNLNEFSAILAHEFAHFSTRDTFYNRFIARAGFTFASILSGLRMTFFGMLNPIYWYLSLFYMIFTYLVGGFSREREFSADFIAAKAFGPSVFASALDKYSTDSVVFETMIRKELMIYVYEGKYLENIYDFHRHYKAQLPSHVLLTLEKKMAQTLESPFGTHPPLNERIDAISNLSSFEQDTVEADISARFIFRDIEDIEHRLSKEIYIHTAPRILKGEPVIPDEYQYGFDEKRLEKYANEFSQRIYHVFGKHLEPLPENLEVVDDIIRKHHLKRLGVDVNYAIQLVAAFLAVIIIHYLGGKWDPYHKGGPSIENVGGVEGLIVNPAEAVEIALSTRAAKSLSGYFRALMTKSIS